MNRLLGLISAPIALIFTLVVAAGALTLGGYDPGAAFGALVEGALGSPRALASVTLVRTNRAANVLEHERLNRAIIAAVAE